MLPGISGTLLAPTFLARLVDQRLSTDPDASRQLKTLHHWWRRARRTVGPAASARAIADAAAIPFLETHAYRVQRLEPHAGGMVGVISRDAQTPVALRITTWDSNPDQEWRAAVRAGRVSGARWGFVFTGGRLRVVDARRTWSRRALEFDLELALRHERSAAALVTIVDAAGTMRRGGTLEEITAASDQHGVEVCAALGSGVLDALTEVVAELDRGSGRESMPERGTFEQAVTIVYRLLFLLFAEARALVPTWHPVYRESYTIEALCRRALTQASRHGLWRAVQAISRLAHHGCRAGDLIVTPFNGRLFSPRHTPLGERARVSDAAVGRAVVALATAPERESRARIAYADLGVEQLGAVYERVLEYEPRRESGVLALARTSLDRKSSGSFYTPRSVTDFLVRRSLHPLVTGRSAEEILRLRVLDPAMGSGAFLVAACRYLGDAVERALVDEGTLPADPRPDERSEVRRLVAQRCLYGVDVNPMAVQLARLSLWLASLSADRPLTFLDHHLTTGDSLVGASFADLGRSPVAARHRKTDTLPLFDREHSTTLAELILPSRNRLALDRDDTPASVHAKERTLARLSAANSPLSRWKDAADLWCAAWFWRDGDGAPGARPSHLTNGVYRDVVAALLGREPALAAHQRSAVVERARVVADRHRFFHWELEFPEVFFAPDGQRDADGGFDAVLGNPPWDVLRADTGDQRHRDDERGRYRDALRFFRESRIYRHQGRGHTNRYQLFVERALQLLKPGGRLALIVPAGLATDHGSGDLRRALLDGARVDRLLGFDNRMAIFPIHRDVRFLLVTATNGAPTDRLACSFGHSDAQWLDQLPDDAADDPPAARALSVSRAAIASWDADHLALPWLTRDIDFDILSRAANTIPRLDAASGWGVRFGRELNATDDRNDFVAGGAGGPSHLPVIDGKHLEPFRVFAARSNRSISVTRAAALLDRTRTFERSRLAYRDVASATNRLTLIAARLPPGTVSTHTVFCSKDTLGSEAQYCLLGLLNSLVANYLVRMQVTTHVTTAVMARLRVPRPPSTSLEFGELAALARQLETTGVDANTAAYARLNRLAARLYGLSDAEYEHVVSSFPLLSPEVREACLSSPAPVALPDRRRRDATRRRASR